MNTGGLNTLKGLFVTIQIWHSSTNLLLSMISVILLLNRPWAFLVLCYASFGNFKIILVCFKLNQKLHKSLTTHQMDISWAVICDSDTKCLHPHPSPLTPVYNTTLPPPLSPTPLYGLNRAKCKHSDARHAACHPPLHKPANPPWWSSCHKFQQTKKVFCVLKHSASKGPWSADYNARQERAHSSSSLMTKSKIKVIALTWCGESSWREKMMTVRPVPTQNSPVPH